MKKKKKRKFYQIFNILLLIVSIIFLGIIYVTNVLNIGYFIGICFLILIILKFELFFLLSFYMFHLLFLIIYQRNPYYYLI